LVVFQAGLAPIERLRAIVADGEGRVEPRRRYLSQFMILDWKEQLAETTVQRQQAIGKLWDSLVLYAREMHEAGIELLAGSDVAVLNIYPGSSLHDELKFFVSDLKMSPAEALDRATRRSARFLGIGDSVGTIERGKVADLVLLDGNPLQDITSTRRIVGVMSRGVFYDQGGLAKLLEAVAAAPDIKVDDWGRTARR
jgi:imidazolonepropionase-like amidohydrolase